MNTQLMCSKIFGKKNKKKKIPKPILLNLTY